MLSKRFLPAFIILCVLLVGCAFAASSEQPKEGALPEGPGILSASDIQAVQSVVIVDPDNNDQVLHAIMLGVGGLKQLKALVSADTPAEEGVTWSSNNPTIATVSPVGEVRGLATELTNPAIITATSISPPNKTAYISAYVGNPNVRVSGISIYKEGSKEITSGDIEVSIIVGTSVNLVAVLQPAQADIRHVDWYTANSDIAGVGWNPAIPTNATVTAYRAGRTLVEAVTLDGQKRRTCYVTAYVEQKGAVEGGCATGFLPSAAGMAILAPLLLLFKRKRK